MEGGKQDAGSEKEGAQRDMGPRNSLRVSDTLECLSEFMAVEEATNVDIYRQPNR